MKPVPFAEYLARQQQAAPASRPNRGRWPPRDRADAAAEPARKSPLLRQTDKDRRGSPARSGAAPRAGSSAWLSRKAARPARKELDEERAPAARRAGRRSRQGARVMGGGRGRASGRGASRGFRRFRDALRPGGRQYPAAVSGPADHRARDRRAGGKSRGPVRGARAGPVRDFRAARSARGAGGKIRRGAAPDGASSPTSRSTCACASRTPSSRPSSVPGCRRSALFRGAATRSATGMSETRAGNHHRPPAGRGRGRPSRRRVENRLCRFRHGDDGLLPGAVDSEFHQQGFADHHRALFQPGEDGGFRQATRRAYRDQQEKEEKPGVERRASRTRRRRRARSRARTRKCVARTPPRTSTPKFR